MFRHYVANFHLPASFLTRPRKSWSTRVRLAALLLKTPHADALSYTLRRNQKSRYGKCKRTAEAVAAEQTISSTCLRAVRARDRFDSPAGCVKVRSEQQLQPELNLTRQDRSPLMVPKAERVRWLVPAGRNWCGSVTLKNSERNCKLMLSSDAEAFVDRQIPLPKSGARKALRPRLPNGHWPAAW